MLPSLAPPSYPNKVGTSRRALLGRVGAVAGIAAVSGVVGPSEKRRPGVLDLASAESAPALPAVIRGAHWRVVRPGVAPGTLPPIGTPSLPIGHLLDVDGVHIGRFEASAMPGSSTHLHHLTFDDGTLSAVGPSSSADASFAVIGGTGKFAGAFGSYHLSQNPAPSGGTAEFTFAITVPGGQQ
jgi:hypothetical protein